MDYMVQGDLSNLPQNDFYNREIKPIKEGVEYNMLNDLIQQSRAKMKPLIQRLLDPSWPEFDLANTQQVLNLKNQLQSKLKKVTKGSPAYQALENQINILDDLNKINQLQLLSIPGEGSRPSSYYCTLAESAGGVTEKLSLIKLETVINQLDQLVRARPDTFGSVNLYLQSRPRFKLSTEAILKLPKRNDIKEVQRESMALNASRILGLDTTESSMVTYAGKPALFVPFSNIKLIREYGKGEIFKIAGLSGQTYEHYSTINPLGDGLEADAHLDDFGQSLALFYLCSDTDAVGGYLQNKAIRNDKSLFIFDQVIMASDKLGLDSRLSLQPIEFFFKHTRHGQGRNRTLIEDSSMDEKFNGLMTLKSKAEQLYAYADNTVAIHNREIRRLQNELSSLPRAEAIQQKVKINALITLRNDASLLKTVMKNRITKIDAIFPKHDRNITPEQLKQSLILEKLLHNPVLFTESGRPYKNPWTSRHNNPVKSISTDPGSGDLLLSFEGKVSADIVNFINKHHASDKPITVINNSIIRISPENLDLISETMLYPEQQLGFLNSADYLNQQDLNVIQQSYGKGNRSKIMEAINKYRGIMNNPRATSLDKLNAIVSTERTLNDLKRSSKNTGFAHHVLKKFQLDAQQQLQKLIQKDQIPLRLNAAFIAAREMDRMTQFNHVLAKAIRENKVNAPEFLEYLNACMSSTEKVSNYREAKEGSLRISRSSEAIIQPDTATKPAKVHENDINLLQARKGELAEERNALRPKPAGEQTQDFYETNSPHIRL